MSSSESTHRREQACALLQSLVDPRHLQNADEAAALRHLAIAALNLASELPPEALTQACASLPLVTLYAHWEQDLLGPDEVATQLVDQGRMTSVGREPLRRRLQRAHASSTSSKVRRAPRSTKDAPSEDDPRRLALARAALDDQALRELASLKRAPALDRLIERAGLLASVIESPLPALQELLPPWPIDRSAGGLLLLQELEDGPAESCPPALQRLKSRSQDFERSLAENLESQGLLIAVRAALAFGPPPTEPLPSNRELRHFLASFTIFADDPALLSLAQALMETRHRVLLNLQGALPLSALQPWTLYLRGDCAELADSRDITLREATHYAHYCLHLLNLCDLVNLPGVALHDPLRRALMSREEELRELVLLGQRQGLSDQQADLARFDLARWRAEGPRAALADRLARLCGAWIDGEVPGPLGTSARLADPMVELARDALDIADASADALANLARDVHILGHRVFEELELPEALRLLALSLALARDKGILNQDMPPIIDLRALSPWLNSAQRGAHHRTLLRTLLQSASLDELLSRASEHPFPGLHSEVGPDHATLCVSFDLDPALDALLTLLATTPEDDPLFTALSERLSAGSHRFVFSSTTVAASQYSERKTTDNELSG